MARNAVRTKRKINSLRVNQQLSGHQKQEWTCSHPKLRRLCNARVFFSSFYLVNVWTGLKNHFSYSSRSS